MTFTSLMTSPQKQFHTTQNFSWLLLHQAPFVLIFTVFLFHGRDGNETGNRRRESANHSSHTALLLLFQKLKQTVCVCVCFLLPFCFCICVWQHREGTLLILASFTHSLMWFRYTQNTHTHGIRYYTRSHGNRPWAPVAHCSIFRSVSVREFWFYLINLRTHKCCRCAVPHIERFSWGRGWVENRAGDAPSIIWEPDLEVCFVNMQVTFSRWQS